MIAVRLSGSDHKPESGSVKHQRELTRLKTSQRRAESEWRHRRLSKAVKTMSSTGVEFESVGG